MCSKSIIRDCSNFFLTKCLFFTAISGYPAGYPVFYFSQVTTFIMQYITYHVLAGKRRRGEGQESTRPCWSPVPDRPYPTSTPHAERVRAKGAPVYMTAVMENLAAKILELAGFFPDISSNDEELNKLLSGVTIAQGGGDLPNIKESKA